MFVLEVIYCKGRHGTVCDEYWGSQEARVVCRMPGFSGGTALQVRDLEKKISHNFRVVQEKYC